MDLSMKLRMKALVRPLVPRAALSYMRPWLRRFPLGRSWLSYTWEGVYPRFSDAPSDGGDRGAAWQSFDAEVAAVEAADGDAYAFLPLVASIVAAERPGRRIRVIDYGGGLGGEYRRLLQALPDTGVDYHVVELAAVCREGAARFIGDDRIHFHTTVPVGLSDVTIVHMNSALEYVEDYAALLVTLCSYRPDYVVIVRTPICDVPSFVTVQLNVPRSMIPCWFLNRAEIGAIFEQQGYSAVFSGRVAETVDQDNLPAAYRAERCCLIFARAARQPR
jgi:putative methyltransferase (TIGR04325 family)